MNINDLFPSKYLRASDLGDRQFHVTMAGLRTEQMPKQGKKGQTEQKAILFFRGTEKGLILSATNARTIAELHGPETNDWPGKRITLYVEFNVEAFGKKYNVVRVRPTVPLDANGTANDTHLPEDRGEINHDTDEEVAEETPDGDNLDNLIGEVIRREQQIHFESTPHRDNARKKHAGDSDLYLCSAVQLTAYLTYLSGKISRPETTA